MLAQNIQHGIYEDNHQKIDNDHNIWPHKNRCAAHQQNIKCRNKHLVAFGKPVVVVNLVENQCLEHQ